MANIFSNRKHEYTCISMSNNESEPNIVSCYLIMIGTTECTLFQQILTKCVMLLNAIYY